MNKLFYYSFLIPAVFSTFLSGEKADFRTAENFAPENLRKLVGTRNVRPVWISGRDHFIYEYRSGNITNYYMVNVKKRSKRPLFNNRSLAQKISGLIREAADADNLGLSGLVLDQDLRMLSFRRGDRDFRYDLHKEDLVITKKNPESDLILKSGIHSPDRKWILYAKGHDIFISPADCKKKEQGRLTFDGEKWFSYSSEEGVDDPDLISSASAGWFPDSGKIYCLRKDKRKVKDLFLVHSLSEPRPTLETYKYAMAGDKEIPEFHISVIDIKNGKVTVIDTRKWEGQQIGSESATGIYPGIDSRNLFFTRTSRDWRDVELCRYDLKTNELEIVLTEQCLPYWNADFQQFHETGDNGSFIWWSEKSGRGHLYLHDRNGREILPLTRGDLTVAEVLKTDRDGRFVLFAAYGRDPEENPYHRKYYRVGFDGNGFADLTPEKGMHTIYTSDSSVFFIDTYSTVTTPDISVLKNNTGKILMRLETLDISGLISSGWKPPVPFKVKAADGLTDLYGVMWKPFNMEKGRKYPVISYVYPGPQGEPVPDTFFLVRDKRVSNIPLAQLGFIVITVGQRGGSPLRTREYHSFGYGNARDYPLEDNKFAIEQLAERYDFMDISRVGIYGRSGGGFMSAAAILTYPDFYKVAVSSCGNHDNNIYDYIWGELHYGINNKIPANADIAGNLKGHLLLLHGETDNNVHPANTLRLANELIKKGKRFDMMLFPGKSHDYDEYTSYIERMMWHYFAEHLLGDYRTNIDIYNNK